MSNAYDRCKETERRGEEMLAPFFERESGGHWILVKGHPMTQKLQKDCGDVFISLPGGRMPSVDIKAEEQYTGNLVYEDWSNARFIGDPEGHAREGSTSGWVHHCRSEVLAFAFLDVRKVGFCRTTDFLRFANDYQTYRQVLGPRPQKKHRQLNTTILRLIRISDFKRAFPFHQFQVDQGELFEEALQPIHRLVSDDRIPWRHP